MNPLLKYLSDTGLSQTQFARRYGFNPVTVSEWVRGRRHPSLAAAFRMEKATSGAIVASAWLKKNGKRAA